MPDPSVPDAAVEAFYGAFSTALVGRDYDGNHMVRHDPARVLRQVAAHRKILEIHSPHRYGACPVCWRKTPLSSVREDFPCPTLLALAEVYGLQGSIEEETVDG